MANKKDTGKETSKQSSKKPKSGVKKKTALKKGAKKSTSTKTKRTTTKKWSGKVTATSDALDLKGGIFSSNDPKQVARSLKRSANRSHRRKGTPFQSAMSMLNFYINRAGDQLPEKQKNVLEKAKDELRVLFGRKDE